MKNAKCLILYITAFLICLSSCGDKKRDGIVALLQQWSNKEILFPANPVFTVQGKDTVSFPLSGEFRILTYADTVGCMGCKLQLGQWKKYIEEMDSMGIGSVQYLFFFSPEKRRDIMSALKAADFVYPICIDEKGELNRLNHLPTTDLGIQTFLLDKENKVVGIGNPVLNPHIKELYRHVIQGTRYGQDHDKQVMMTQAVVDEMKVSLARFDWQKEQKVLFKLKNTGDHPLVIAQVNTSCGCTTVDYSQEPVPPGKEAVLTVTYKAERPEHFNKTITVYCNAESSPIRLSISGDAQ